ncbi:MAG: molybdopterin oxidoreductase family protein [Fimbriimonadaceae bacterium]
MTTDYIWRARDKGAKLIMIDPRVTPVAPAICIFLFALVRFCAHAGNPRVLIEEGYTDDEFITNHTNGWEETKATALAQTLEEASRISGVNVEDIVKAGHMWGKAKTSFLLHARGIEHHTKGVDNVLSCINIVLATGRIGRPGCGYGTITGQGNGQGGREHGHKCDQLPGNRDIEVPEHREYIANVWGIPEADLPCKGHSAQEIMNMIHEGEIKALISICFNPLVSLPDSNFTREALSKLEHYTAIDFFLSETAHHADIVMAGSLHEEEDGTSTSAEGRVIRIKQAISPPGDAKQDTQILLELARRLGRGEFFKFNSSEDIFNELRIASKGGTADYYGITYERVENEYGVFWPCPEIGHPGTPRFFEDKKFYKPDGKAVFNPTPHRPSAEDPDDEFPIILTTGRVVMHYLSGTQTRRLGGLVDLCAEPFVEIHPTLAEKYGIQDQDWVAVTSRRGSVTVQAKVVTTIRPDTVFIPYHWPGKRAANNLTGRFLDPTSKIPEFKRSVVNIRRTNGPDTAED